MKARCATAARLLALMLVLWLRCAAQAGVAQADSADFTVDTTDSAPGVGGTAYADSADFALKTLDVWEAESGDFTLDTTDTDSRIGGIAFADSADFTLDTTAFDPIAVDIGLRIRDGAVTLKIGCEPAGTLTSPLRIRKNGTTYGIILVAPNAPDASPIRIQTSSGIKALQKLP